MLNNENEAILQQEHQKLNKPNVLIKVAHSRELNTRDKKLYNILIRELLLLNLQEFKKNEITFSLSELSNKLDTSAKNTIYENLENLMNTIITFEDTKSITRAVCISSYTKPKENADNAIKPLTIRFDTRLTTKIIENAEQYAKLDLLDLNSLKITHSITLYEIFIRSLGTYHFQRVNYTEQELRRYLNLQDKYKDIRQFNQQVIKKSIEEINSKTQLDITYKRVKINKKNVYKFELNQMPRYSFNQFKKTIIEHYKHIVFQYKNNEYCISRDLEDKKAKYLLVNAKTYKTLTTEKAEEIFSFMFEDFKISALKFVHKFVMFKDLNIKNSNIEIDENDYEELDFFFENYSKSRVKI